MSDIFLSYKSEDREKAQKIAQAIEKMGYKVWWDRVIPPGRTFDDVIEEELNAANCIVVLWSEESVKSEWVKTEASEGNKRKILVPVKIEDVTPPLAFRRIQAAKLTDWDGTSHHHEFDLLIQSVGNILGKPASMDSRGPEQNKIEGKEKEEQEVEAKKEQEEQVHLEGEERTEEKTRTNSVGMKFALIPAGKFSMGSPPDEKDRYDNEGPVHEVTIRKPFYLGIYPVIQQEWQAIMGDNPSSFEGDKLPVEQVSWDDVQNFITKLNEKEGSDKYRLPTEAEWEYAARAGTTTRYSFGDDESELGEFAWYVENSGSRAPKKGDYFGYNKDDWFENKWNGKTHPVGQKKPNPWEMYDMHGNVLEWVQDEWHDSYDGAPSDGGAWEDGSGAVRVFRGGSWFSFAGICRSADRLNYDPGYRDYNLGFRLLQEL